MNASALLARYREGRPPATHLVIRRATSPRWRAREAAAVGPQLVVELYAAPAPRSPPATRAPPPTFAKPRPRTVSDQAPCARARTRASRTASVSRSAPTAPSPSVPPRRGPPAPTPRPPPLKLLFQQLERPSRGPVARGPQTELCAARRAAPGRRRPAPAAVDPARQLSRARAGAFGRALPLKLIELPVEAPGGPRLSLAARGSPGARRGLPARAWCELWVHRWAARLRLCGCQPIAHWRCDVASPRPPWRVPGASGGVLGVEKRVRETSVASGL